MYTQNKTINDFSFLKDYYPLNQLTSFVFSYLDSDPNSSIIKQGMILEHVIKVMLQKNGLYCRKGNGEYPKLVELVDIADENNLLPTDYRVLQKIDSLRKMRNTAVHEFVGTKQDALDHLEFLYSLTRWFMDYWGKYKDLVINQGFFACEKSGYHYGNMGYEDDYADSIMLPCKTRDDIKKYSLDALKNLHF